MTKHPEAAELGSRRAAQWWRYYDLAFGPVHEDRVALYEAVLGQYASRPVRDVLELGCGTGRFLVALARRGYALTGVDLDGAALAVARAKCQEAGVHAELVGADLALWEPDGSWDAVIAPNNSLKWLPTHEALRHCLARFAAALRPGGVAVLDLTFEESEWRTADWGTADDLREHAYVTQFAEEGITGQYRCYYGVPDLEGGRVSFIEEFSIDDQSEEVFLEEKSRWLLFSARELAQWVANAGPCGSVVFCERGEARPVEVAQAEVERTGGQYLTICRRP